MRHVIPLALMLAAGCRGAEIDVRNHSSMRLQHVSISAKGASTTIDAIEPGAAERTSLCPRGEAGTVDVAFLADRQQYRRQLPVYFECDFLYRVQVDVSPELDVTAVATLR